MPQETPGMPGTVGYGALPTETRGRTADNLGVSPLLFSGTALSKLS